MTTTMTDYFFSSKPAFPWSIEPIGLPALGILALLLVLFTIWTYFGHPQATRKRLFIILMLRLLALAVALLTAVRPSVGVSENPKVPSVLLIGVDTSESMTVEDEVGPADGKARYKAVRRALEKCQPILDDLQNEQNVSVVIYNFSTPDFSEAVNRWTPQTPSDGKRSDYGTYLYRTFDRWQGERYIRAHILIGDGQDNGESFNPAVEAAKWGRRGTPIHTVVVGQEQSKQTAQDLAVTSVQCNPSPAPIKTKVTVTARVNAYGYVGSRVTARVFINDAPVGFEEFTLERVKDNELRVEVNAPEKKGEYKVKVEVGVDKDGKITPLPGELSPLNNWSETYLTVTKDGVRVLIVDQLRSENTGLRDAIRNEKRFDVYEGTRQTDHQP